MPEHQHLAWSLRKSYGVWHRLGMSWTGSRKWVHNPPMIWKKGNLWNWRNMKLSLRSMQNVVITHYGSEFGRCFSKRHEKPTPSSPSSKPFWLSRPLLYLEQQPSVWDDVESGRKRGSCAPATTGGAWLPALVEFSCGSRLEPQIEISWYIYIYMIYDIILDNICWFNNGSTLFHVGDVVQLHFDPRPNKYVCDMLFSLW